MEPFYVFERSFNAPCYLEQITDALDGGQPLDDKLFQYLSPLGWEHINLTGDYVWRRNSKIAARSRFKPIPNP